MDGAKRSAGVMRAVTWLLLASCLTVGAADEPPVDRGNVVMPERISEEQPATLADDFVSGRVIFQVDIDTEGRVRNPHVLRADDPRFADWALPAISEWRYRPATQAGEPVSVAFTISVAFRGTFVPGDRPARIYRKFEPELSTEERDRLGGAEVDLKVMIAANGRVKDVQVRSSTDDAFAAAAVAAVRRWTYVPAVRQGKQIPWTAKERLTVPKAEE